MEDIIIVGSGPAGLTAGIYAARAGRKPVVLEGLESGGQLMQTQHVANYPGFPETVSGPTIIGAMRAQAEKAGVKFVMDVVESVDFSGETKRLSTMMGETLEAKTVILATGAGVTKTNLPGEAKYWGRGISACLTCDGAFYAGKRVIVVGTGPAAVGAKTYLTRCGAEVVAICAPDEVASFEGDGVHFTHITLKTMGTVPAETVGTDPAGTRTSPLQMGTVPVDSKGTAPVKSVGTVPADGLFLVTARTPQTAFLKDAVARDVAGYVMVTGVKTSVPGVFAAGDCARPNYKQAVIAAGDGALAALEALAYLAEKNRR